MKNEFKTACRIITDVEADIWYYVENGVWTQKDPPEYELDIINNTNMCKFHITEKLI